MATFASCTYFRAESTKVVTTANRQRNSRRSFLHSPDSSFKIHADAKTATSGIHALRILLNSTCRICPGRILLNSRIPRQTRVKSSEMLLLFFLVFAAFAFPFNNDFSPFPLIFPLIDPYHPFLISRFLFPFFPVILALHFKHFCILPAPRKQFLVCPALQNHTVREQ